MIPDGLRGGDREIVVRPTHDPTEASYGERIYEQANRAMPDALLDWERCVNFWCDEYRARWPKAEIVEVLSEACVYVFDRKLERMVVPYGIAGRPDARRDLTRMRRYPDVNLGVLATEGKRAFPADRGHFLAHAAGGELDINLFAHRSELNRGRSLDGKRFRTMERYVARTPGTFFFHRPIYDDRSAIPSELEYGILVDDTHWWIERFSNKEQRGDADGRAFVLRGRAALGRQFEITEQSGWPHGHGDWESVSQQVPFTAANGRRGRIDLVVQIDDGTTVVVETKATDWDAMLAHRVGPNVRRHVRQLLRYVDHLDRNQGVHPALVYPKAPRNPTRRSEIEAIAYAAFVQVVWRDVGLSG